MKLFCVSRRRLGIHFFLLLFLNFHIEAAQEKEGTASRIVISDVGMSLTVQKHCPLSRETLHPISSSVCIARINSGFDARSFRREMKHLKEGSLMFVVSPDENMESTAAADSSFDHNGWSQQHIALTHLRTALAEIHLFAVAFTSSMSATQTK